MGSFLFLHKKFLLFTSFLRAYVSPLFFALFGFFNKIIFRAQSNELNCLDLDSEPVERKAMTKELVEDVSEISKKGEKEDDIKVIDGKENESFEEDDGEPKFFFKFKFQTYREEDEDVKFKSLSNISTNKYEFNSREDFNHYSEDLEQISYTVEEFCADADRSLIGNEGIVREKDFGGVGTSPKKLEAEKFIDSDHNLICNKRVVKNYEHLSHGVMSNYSSGAKDRLPENFELVNLVEGSTLTKGKGIESEKSELRGDNAQVMSEDFVASDSDSDSITSSQEFVRRFIASTTDGFLSDKDFEDPSDLDSLRDIHMTKMRMNDEDLELEDIYMWDLSSGYEADDFDDEDAELMEEFRELESRKANNEEELVDKPNKQIKSGPNSDDEGADDSEKSSPSRGDSEDSNGLESLWEHQDLIEQLKMELKKVKATGLPTILEEDECPKVMDDLKPWKIEEKFQLENPVSEIHKFYRSYRERMRKFDILSYQKMYAMGLIQSKDPLQAISCQKASSPALTSSLMKKIALWKRKKSDSDPIMNFIKELHSELETVYVGQMCLSWEFLHWQYEKALELWESDRYGIRQYNEVAGEFQQFQVLLQRFIENEAFEGPRVQNYIKKRCVFRNLLQVPVIREDSAKGRGRAKSSDAITSDMIAESLEETIRIFWRFVGQDKDIHCSVQKGGKGTQIQPQDPDELELFAEIVGNLQKKEKKLMEILRRGNCILKKIKRQNQVENNADEVLCFFSQVDMKLIARVLNMSRVTKDQLLWCHNKLSKIKFCSRKIYVEPSFLLFPC